MTGSGNHSLGCVKSILSGHNVLVLVSNNVNWEIVEDRGAVSEKQCDKFLIWFPFQ